MQQPLTVRINALSNTIHRKVDEFVTSEISNDKNNFTATNARVIGYLLINDDKDIFQKDIEDILELRRSTVSTLLQGMEKKGFITRESVNYDARVKKIVPTPLAIELHNKIAKVLDRFEKKFNQNISDSEIKTFLAVLQKLQNNLE